MPRITPWHLAGALAVVAALALVWAATRRPASSPGASPPATQVAAAPDISNLTPREQFGRLADRIETAMEGGDTATVVRFFPMVEAAFTNLTPADRDTDARFHIGLLRARIGHFDAALAQVDSITAVAPAHLFASYLRAIIGDFRHDSTMAQSARRQFRHDFAAETARQRPEYAAHRQMLDQFLASIPPAAGR